MSVPPTVHLRVVTSLLLISRKYKKPKAHATKQTYKLNIRIKLRNFIMKHYSYKVRFHCVLKMFVNITTKRTPGGITYQKSSHKHIFITRTIQWQNLNLTSTKISITTVMNAFSFLMMAIKRSMQFQSKIQGTKYPSNFNTC